MKKFGGALILVFAVFFCSCFFSACDETITAKFTQETISINVGQEYDPYDYIEDADKIDEMTREKVSFKSSNNNIVYVTPEKTVVAIDYGDAKLYVLYNNTQIAEVKVNVAKPPVQLETPINLHFDAEQGALVWNYTYYELNGNIQLLKNYELEITKSNSQPVVVEVTDKNYYELDTFGQYSAKIKAVAPTNAYLSSEYSAPYNFYIMSKPLDVEYNDGTKILSWDANENPTGTKYTLTYTLAGQEEVVVENLTTTQYEISETVGAGIHQFCVTTVPANSTYFKGVSDVLKIEKLVQPKTSEQTLHFENGVVSWNGNNKATSYTVTIFKYDQSQEKWIETNYSELVKETGLTTVKSSLPQNSCTDAGQYKVSVVANGNVENLIYDSDVSEWLFTKLDLPKVQYNPTSKIFEVVNSASVDGKSYMTITSNTSSSEWVNTASKEFDKSDSGKYGISAKFIALNPYQEIDSEISNTFFVNDEIKDLTYIQNLSNIDLRYVENSVYSYVQYTPIDSDCSYQFFIDDEESNLLAVDNKYNLDYTSNLFNELTEHNYRVKVTKEPNQQKIYYVDKEFELCVKQIPSPTVLALNGNAVEVISTLAENVVKVEYKISVDDKSFVETQQLKTGDKWVVKARFVANNQKFVEDDIDTYYSSSAYALFNIEKLQQPQNLIFDYANNKLVFDKVDNATEYNIYQNDELLQTVTTNEAILENVIGEIEIEAIPATWATMTVNKTGYLNSNKTSYTLYKVDGISNLYLEKDDNHIVTAKWTAPTKTYSKDVTYSVYVKYVDETEDNDFVLEASGITNNQYTFADDDFSDEGDYIIKIEIVSPDNNFYATETTESVTLTRLSAPTSLKRVKNSDNELQIVNYNSNVMTGITVNMFLNEESEPYEHFSIIDNKIEYSVDGGDKIKISVSVNGSFNVETKTYNLNSLYSDFYIQRLGEVKNLGFAGFKNNNKTFNFSWEAMEQTSDTKPAYVSYTYYVEALSSTGDVINTFMENTSSLNTLTFSYSNPNSLKVYVQEVVSTSYSWSTVSKDKTQYLSSTVFSSVILNNENSVNSLTVDITDEKVIVGWKYTPQEITDESYSPVFNVTLTTPLNVPISDASKLVSDYNFNNVTQKYEREYSKADFADVGDYKVSVIVSSNKTISSQENWATISKLRQIECLSIDGDEGVCKYTSTDSIVFPDDSKIVVSSDESVTVKSGAIIDLSSITNTTQNTSISIYHKAPENPVEVSTGYYKYYLDSDTTVFNIIRLPSVQVNYNAIGDMLEWEDVLKNETMSYTISITRTGGSSSTITGYTTNELSMSAAELTTDSIIAGKNYVQVRTIVEPTDITPYNEENNNVGYLSSQFSTAYEIIKLDTPQNVELTANEAQDEVTITWDAVTGENITYNIYVYEQGQEKGAPVYSTENLFATSSSWFATGTKCVQIEAVATGKITSSLSDAIVCVRLDDVTEKSVNLAGILEWKQTQQIKQNASIANSFQYYKIEVLNSTSQKMFEVNVGKNLSYDLMSNESNYLQNLNGENFVVNIVVVGSGQSQNGIITLSSSSTLEQYLQGLKLAKPIISVENGQVVITDTNVGVEGVEYYVTISNGSGNIYNQTYTTPITLPADTIQTFNVSAYATTTSLNKIKSNTETCDITKLTAPINLNVSLVAESDEIAQNQVELTWASVENATGYYVYVDGTKIAETDALTYVFEENVFASAKQYSVQIQAVATNDYLYSDLSESISVIRLNSMQGAYIDEDAVVHFANTQQYNDVYTIYTYLDGTVLKSLTTLANNTAIYEDYQTYLQDKDTFSGGLFTIKVQYIGSGITDENNVCTLSSAESLINGFKLYAPTLTINADKAIIEIEQASSQIPSGQVVGDFAQNVFSAKINNEFAKTQDGNNVDKIETNEFDYPDCWLAGAYTFTAQTLPNETLNVLPSDVTEKTTTRLDAPTNLTFTRMAVDDEVNYFTDSGATNDKIGTVLQFSFDEVLNAKFYSIFNTKENYSNIQETTSLTVEYNFEKFVYSDESITLISIADEGGKYINSKSTTITYNILKPVTKFYTDGTNVIWNTTETTMTGFVIRANSNDGQVKYWQTTSNSQMQSELTDLLFEGNISMNIKLIGNVTSSPIYDNIVLDSRYITKDNDIANQDFYKIEKIQDLGTNKGFFTFTKPTNADKFKAYVYDENEILITSVYLDDYKTIISTDDDTTFLGYSDFIANLNSSKTYTIYVVAENENTEQNILFSDSSNQITAQVLANANTTQLSLITGSDNNLTKKFIRVNVTPNASGVWLCENGSYWYDNDINSNIYVYQPIITNVDSIEISFASAGSTSSSASGHYLTSVFNTSISFIVPAQTTISVVDGHFVWENITENVDGYYVYVNDNLYGNSIYTQNELSLDDTFGGDTNNSISLKVVPVCNSNNVLWGPESNYQISVTINDTPTYNNSFTKKLHKPQNFDVSEGMLVWSEGVSGLDLYNNDYLTDLIDAISTNRTKTNVDALCEYIESLFTSPITIYSRYSGFNDLKLNLMFTDTDNEVYTLTTDAYKFLTLTQTQLNNLDALCATLLSDLPSLITHSTEKDPYSLTMTTFGGEEEYVSAVLQKILDDFDSTNYITFHNCGSNDGVWPTVEMLFEEFDDEQSASFIGGLYTLKISQYGNDFDWLNSTTSESQNIFVTEKLKIWDISSEDNNFFIDIQKYNLNNSCLYNNFITESVDTNIVYVLVGEDSEGNRTVLKKTFGIDFNGNVRIDLTDLVEKDILTPQITKLFVYVDGSYQSTNSQSKSQNKWQVITGVKSRVVNITVLPQLAPQFVDGEINLAQKTPQFGFEIKSVNGVNTYSEVITNTYWKGEDSYFLKSGETYQISMRNIGASEISLDEVVIITGKSFTFTAQKLTTPEVKVNNYGVFEWSSVYNTNSSGYVLYVDDGDDVTKIVSDIAGQTTYESNITGYNNYKFRMLGTTSGLIKNDGTVYYINSNIHNSPEGENGDGSNAIMLTTVEEVFVEDGLLKWTPINKPEDDQTLKDYYKIIIDNNLVFYSSELSVKVYGTDTNGNKRFDLTSQDVGAGQHKIEIQAYLLVEENGSQQISKTLFKKNAYDEVEYYQLLSERYETEVTKSAEPKNIKIVNGEIVWDGNDEDINYQYQIISEDATINGTTTERTLWHSDIATQTNYTVRIKAYQNGNLCSSYTTMADSYGVAKEFQKVEFDMPNISYYTDVAGNYMTFKLNESALSYGLNIAYKLNSEQTEYTILKCSDAEYANIVEQITANSEVTFNINVSVLSHDSTYFECCLQLTYLGETNWLASNYSSELYYTIPEQPTAVYFDEETCEFYVEAVNTKIGYNIKDEILNDDDEVVAVYYYNIAMQDYSVIKARNYFKTRQIEDNKVGTINFTPVVMGYKHRVSFATLSTIDDNVAKMSSYTTCETICEQSLFEVETDIFAENSGLYSCKTQSKAKEFFEDNANSYGTQNNAYIISSANDFANLNLRLEKYSYLSTYSVEVTNLALGIIEIEDTNNFYFKQNNDITVTNIVIGLRNEVSLGIQYTGFDNIYDGQNNTITYTLTPTNESDKFALFRIIEKNGSLKNLKINGTINYSSVQQLGGLTAENNGTIANVEILDLNITNFAITTLALESCEFGAVACENNGTITNVKNNFSTALTVSVSYNKMSVYVGGIVAKNNNNATIQQCGNKITITVQGTKEVYVGGVVANNYGSVIKSYNSTTITASSSINQSNVYVGGVVGYNNGGEINYCYAKGEVISSSQASGYYVCIGGLVGYTNNTNIKNSYSGINEITLKSSGTTVYSGTLIGKLDAEARPSNNNYCANNFAIGNDLTYSGDFVEKVDISADGAIKTLVSDLNGDGEKVYTTIDGNIAFVWEKE